MRNTIASSAVPRWAIETGSFCGWYTSKTLVEYQKAPEDLWPERESRSSNWYVQNRKEWPSMDLRVHYDSKTTKNRLEWCKRHQYLFLTFTWSHDRQLPATSTWSQHGRQWSNGCAFGWRFYQKTHVQGISKCIYNSSLHWYRCGRNSSTFRFSTFSGNFVFGKRLRNHWSYPFIDLNVDEIILTQTHRGTSD